MTLRSLFARAGLVLGLLLAVAPAGWVLATCGTATFQEGNPLPYAVAIRRLERGVITPVGSDGRTWLARSGPAGGSALEAVLAQRGWVHEDQMGAIHSFRRGDERLQVLERVYTSRYELWRAERVP